MKRPHPDTLLSPTLAILIAVVVACLAYLNYLGGAAVRNTDCKTECAAEYSRAVGHEVDAPLLEVENCEPPAVFDEDWSEEPVEDPRFIGQGVPTLAPPQEHKDEAAAHFFDRPQGRAIAVRVEADAKSTVVDGS